MLSQGIESRLVVVHKGTDDPRVIALPRRRLRRLLARRGAWLINKLRRSDNPVVRTFNIVPMGTAAFLNRMDADIIQMHWIGEDTISIGELARLNKPVVWKLPDIWGFAGTEHYLLPGDPERYREGYSTARPARTSTAWYGPTSGDAGATPNSILSARASGSATARRTASCSGAITSVTSSIQSTLSSTRRWTSARHTMPLGCLKTNA